MTTDNPPLVAGQYSLSMKRKALEDLKKRKSRKNRHKQNHEIRAGAPMYYYCQSCDYLCDVKPEGWFLTPPRKLCGECQGLIDNGWI